MHARLHRGAAEPEGLRRCYGERTLTERPQQFS